MTTNLVGGVSFDAAGQSYTLRFGANELIQLQEKLDTGDDLQALLALLDDAGLKRLRTFFWGGLLGSNPKLTEADAGEVMTAYGMEQATLLIRQAMLKAFPSAAKAMEGEGERPQTAAAGDAGTGTNSSQAGAA